MTQFRRVITISVVAASCLVARPAAAIIVYDPSNYAQNVLAAARALQQINNQVRSLQNEATMLLAMAHNLGRVDFPELNRISAALMQSQALMTSARAIGFRLDTLDAQFAARFPAFDRDVRSATAGLAAARDRAAEAMDAYRDTMRVQDRVVAQVGDDADTLSALASRSQAAEGSLSAAQAGNQLVALVAKQQLQIQQLMAAQYRADSYDRAARAQTSIDAAAAVRRFLGSGAAYAPR